MFTSSSRMKLDRNSGVLKIVVPKYHGNDHGGYSRIDKKLCEVFVTRLVPETTAFDVCFVNLRVYRNVKIELFFFLIFLYEEF